jgi:lipoprotein-anchoring transpeptidase ErfK/SrfK
VDKPFYLSPHFVSAMTIIIVAYGLVTWGPMLWQSSQLPISPATMVASPEPQQAASVAQSSTASIPQIIPASPPPVGYSEYLEVVDGCGPYYDGTCVNMRSGPGTEYPAVGELRNGMVLKVTGIVQQDGHTWYKIGFDGQIRYPERITSDWYVAADYVNVFFDAGERVTTRGINVSSTKRIVVDISKEILYAYDGGTLFMQEPISTGLEFTPTPLGMFAVYRKTPSSYMQGPVPGVSDQYYDLPGVPWDLYFTYDGNAIHGAYWHNKFGQPWSHGCVNLPLTQAHALYEWADLGTPVLIVQDWVPNPSQNQSSSQN